MSNGLRFASPRVNEGYSGSGVATRLASALAYVAVRHNADVMYCFVKSQHVLRIFRQLVGDTAIRYEAPDPVTHKPVVDTDQTIRALERAETHERDVERRDLGVEVHVNHAGIDLHTLEKPVEKNEPLMEATEA